jgi:hypothetical protein
MNKKKMLGGLVENLQTWNIGREKSATVGDNGWILDEVRCVLGGNESMEAEFSLVELFQEKIIRERSIKMQQWPRDITLSRGLPSGAWVDLVDGVSSLDASNMDNSGMDITAMDFLRMLSEGENPEAASVCWTEA